MFGKTTYTGASEYTDRRRGFCGYRSTKRNTSNWKTVQVFAKTTYTGASEYTDRRRGLCGYRSTKKVHIKLVDGSGVCKDNEHKGIGIH